MGQPSLVTVIIALTFNTDIFIGVFVTPRIRIAKPVSRLYNASEGGEFSESPIRAVKASNTRFISSLTSSVDITRSTFYIGDSFSCCEKFDEKKKRI